MTNIDLKDAYLSVAVHKHSQKFLSFIWEENVLPIQSSPIRPVFRSEDIYRTVKTGCCLPKKEGHSSVEIQHVHHLRVKIV